MFDVPATFARTQIELHGPAGQAWLDRLPAIVASCARRWDLALDRPIARLSYNYVVPARRSDGTWVMLKVFSPEGEFVAQAAALRLFDGRGAARTLEIAPDIEALLLERLEPGTPPRPIEDDDAATLAMASVMGQLWRIAPSMHPFPTVADWGRGFARLRAHFDGGTGPFPAPLVERAERVFAELAGSMAASVLLHGDLNYGNVLAARRASWLAIDPKGLVGEPAYETGVLLRDPLPELLSTPHPERILARRIDILSSELGLDRRRVHGWGLAQAVLSAWWNLEDHGHGWEPAIACAELLTRIAA